MKCNSLNTVNQTGFAAIETGLFLDTHPRCDAALAGFCQARDAYLKARADYAASYGPLTIYEASDSCMYDWVKGPWPWEGGTR